MGYNADNLVNGLNTTVSNLPPYRPDWKGIVEQLFRLMNIRVIKHLPGAINPEKERGDRDVRLDAVLDINQFTAIIIKAILYHNNQHYMNSYPMDKSMIAAGVKPVPREIFLWGRENISGKPRSRDAEAIRIHLLPGDEATVTARGIRFRGEFYTCQQAEEENWRFIARNKGAWKVNIAYDPRAPRIIYLRPSDGSTSIPCHLINSESIAADADLAEVEEYYERKVIEDQRAEVSVMQGRVELDLRVEDIVTKAKEMFDEARAQVPMESNRSRLNNINEHRQAEIDRTDEKYQLETLMEPRPNSSGDMGQTLSDGSADLDGEYVPRPRFSNVLSIQERMMGHHDDKS